ncbi:MAG: MFS transporter [Acidimicrobiales bacterium]
MRRNSSRTPLPPGFGTIWVSVALDLVGFGIVLPILPLYAEDFGASPTEVGLLVASFSLMQLIFSPIWGRLSDRIGRKPLLLFSLVGTAIGSLLTGLAGSLWLLFAARIIDGISGASVSVAQASAVDLAPPDQRPRLLGMLGAAFGVGFVVGPALGALAALGDHRLPFFLAAAVAATNALVAWRRLPETHPKESRLQASLARQSMPNDASSRWFEVPGLVQLMAVAFLALVAFSAFEATFALLGERRFELTQASTGAVFAGIGIVMVAVQGGMVHAAAKRFGEIKALQMGLALNAMGLLVLTNANSWPVLIIALGLLVVGQGLVTPMAASVIAGRARSDRRGAVLGAQQSAGSFARVVGPAAGGFLFHHIGVSAPSWFGAGLSAFAVILIFGFRRTGQDVTVE